jgi:hypothetical protein
VIHNLAISAHEPGGGNTHPNDLLALLKICNNGTNGLHHLVRIVNWARNLDFSKNVSSVVDQGTGNFGATNVYAYCMHSLANLATQFKPKKEFTSEITTQEVLF